jgi:D-glucosaminate-6-phosphate ammonia-lyase
MGLRPIINATGSLTRVGGTLMPPEVLEAMAEAARAFIKIEELQEKAGEAIASATGAEAGYVTCGASAGLTLATEACVAGLDVQKMDRLPDTAGMRNEVIIQKAHRNSYDHAVRSVGVRIVEAGYLGFPGAGGTYPWQIEAAINERTAAILHPILGDIEGTVPLSEVTRLAHKHGVPVIVDAAAALPPVSNLRRFISEGADMVTFSGGKAIRGPQPSGILAGRRDLILSVALQHQDMDVTPRTWTFRHLLETGVLAGPPHNGIGRAMKVGKEEIVGLVTALDLYLRRDHDADQEMWREQTGLIVQALAGIPNVSVAELPSVSGSIPAVRLTLNEKALGLTAYDVVNSLIEGDPRIVVAEGHAGRGVLGLNPMTLQPGEAEIVARRLTEVLTARERS